MPQYDEFEEEIIEYFKKQMMMHASQHAQEDIYDLIVKHIHGGEDVRDPTLAVDWGSLFDEHKCPLSGSFMVLEGGRYVCGECGFEISQELFDRGEKERRERFDMSREESELMEKAQKNKLDSHRVDRLYEIAQDEVDEQLAKEEDEKD